jgi:N6-L-threonylcarbamoyladenine synthase
LATSSEKEPSPMFLLALETTCDETGAAVLEGAPGVGVPAIRSSVISSQIDLHERFGGVVPEIAAREHVRQILPVVDEALRRAGVDLGEIGAVAVATRPGLVGALIVGLTAAKSLAMALDVPLIAVDHLEGHLYACQLAHPDREVYPCVGLVVSGGHTSLYACRGPF